MAWGCWKCMGICFACIGYYTLVKVVRIIRLQWTTDGKYCIGDGMGGKTNDNMNMAEYVDDADEGDQQPYGERDNATNPGSKVGERILQSLAIDQLNW